MNEENEGVSIEKEEPTPTTVRAKSAAKSSAPEASKVIYLNGNGWLVTGIDAKAKTYSSPP